VKSQTDRFLRNELLTLSILGALGRSKTYSKSASEQDKNDLRGALRRELIETAREYTTRVNETQHLSNIEKLADGLTAQFASCLANGRFRIGIAQKVLNLYLKYLWCLGAIPEPPHCPFDATILRKLPGCADLTWTSIDTMADYKKLVAAAKTQAGNDSLSAWELRVWNQAQGASTGPSLGSN